MIFGDYREFKKKKNTINIVTHYKYSNIQNIQKAEILDRNLGVSLAPPQLVFSDIFKKKKNWYKLCFGSTETGYRPQNDGDHEAGPMVILLIMMAMTVSR